MLRVWGGGIYEKNVFYEECDKNGIMVWQDFANSCGHPPDDHMWFLENIIAEAEYQVKRLRRHPSIVMWCGGNESSNPWFFSENPPGKKLLHYYLRGVVGDLTVNTPYICSSPHSKSDLGGEPTSGETHGSSWPRKAWIKYTDFRDRIAKSNVGFNSEVALIGPSPMESIKKFMDQDDIYPPSDVAIYHFQKHPDPEQTPNYALDQLRMARELIGPCETAETFVNNAMMAHGEMTKEELGTYRSRKFENGGAMVWMFNECWPNTNWAMVDYYGYKKTVFYKAKRTFAPLAITIIKNGNSYSTHIMNDTLKDAAGKATLTYMDINGKIFWKKEINADCPANSAVQIAKVNAKSTKRKNAFLRATWKVGLQTFEVNFFPQIWKDVDFAHADFTYDIIRKNVKKTEYYETTINIKSANYSRFLDIKIPGTNPEKYILEDNYFDLIPRQTKTVKIKSKSKIRNLKITSLLKS